jgi:hypothetical protein
MSGCRRMPYLLRCGFTRVLLERRVTASHSSFLFDWLVLPIGSCLESECLIISV